MAEVRGLTSDQQYELADLYAIQLTGRQADGQLCSTLQATGVRPNFADEVRQYGLEGQVQATRDLWALE
jgi:hypothetical protein